MDTHFAHLSILSAFLSILTVNGKITSDKYMKDDMLYLNKPFRVPGKLGVSQAVGQNTSPRNRRAAESTPSAAQSDQLRVHTTLLPDKNHNEAIVHWTGKNSTVMFILSREHYSNGSVLSSTLWRSENYGSSFSQVVNFPGNRPLISYYLSAPNDKRKLLFVDNIRNKIYRTTDEGATYTMTIGCPGSTDKLVFHPTNESMISCYSERDRKLYVTNDFCSSWDHVHDYVNPRFFWGVDGYDQDMNIIHMEILDPLTGNYNYKAVTYPYPKNASVDDSLGAIEVDSLLVINEYIFVQKTSQYATWLYVSWKRGPFQMAYFPKNQHPEDLNIINADESQVFIAGMQPRPGLFYTLSELYLSDTKGQVYISSLDRVTSVALSEIHGLRGVFIANPKSGIGTSAALNTMITFDQGGKWSRIAAPVNDYHDKPTNCFLKDGCSLHLTNVVSEETAPGILLGQGNYGKGLTGYDNITLFLSTDGGVTWLSTIDKPDYYEANILDQGGAVIAVPRNLVNNKNIIHYSHDEGNSWSDYTYKNESLRVDAVLNDPGATTRTVVIFGHDKTKEGWVIVMVDFTGILKRQCTDDDFTPWHPTDQNKDHQCLLGLQMTYKRRKPNMECYIGKDFTHAESNKSCTCINDDYECDYGYTRVNTTGPMSCTLAAWFDANKPIGDCPEDGFYDKSKGYRKVASDKCSPDITKLDPVRSPCPIMAADGLHIVLEGRRVVPVNKPVTFLLVQERGSKKTTSYTWNFGDDDKNRIVCKGFDQAKNQTHTYNKRGLYNVSIVAKNAVGTSYVSMIVMVEDKIDGLIVETPHGAQVNTPVLFEVALSSDFDEFFGIKPGVHFMWRFGEETNEKDQKLTWENSVIHTYKKPGNYTVFVEAMNGVDTIFQIIRLPVYGTLTTVQLTFDKFVDQFNDGTLIWSQIFAKALREALMKYLLIDYTRMEVVVLQQTTQTLADVSILPTEPTMSRDDTIPAIVKKLLKLHKANFSVPLNRDGYHHNARVTSANIVSIDMDDASRSYVAVYVCVPILIVAIFVSMLVVLYYKKTFSTARRRYQLLRSQEGGPEPDSLLDDTDDDDPPLDLNIDEDNRRLALAEDDNLVGSVDPLGLLSADRRNPDV